MAKSDYPQTTERVRNQSLLKEIIRPACEAGGQSASPRRWPCRAWGTNQ